MRDLELIIVFSSLLFGAYAEFRAGKTVLKMKKEKVKTAKNTTSDSEFMTRALELSKHALQGDQGHPFGSVVVKEGKIIGEGWNRSIVLKDPSSHAEVEAIRSACAKLGSTDLRGATIYASAQPCPMCLSLIYLTGISKVYYCIPHSKVEAFNEDLSVSHIFTEMRKSPTERAVREVQILPEAVDKYIDSYALK